ncbi:IQ-domain 3 isoform 5 [Hibiscus syriacus]|uniref:IQ-domain 3 isoform 5 n=1 Tax=Hibiscus syriacus TaxID=106335 RepID=A0A6A2WWZ5_HIBSY|nr:IQ-domain 3 isoform 5 [Hibiscus syriacus]
MGKTRDWFFVVKKAFSSDSKKDKETSKSKKKWHSKNKDSRPEQETPPAEDAKIPEAGNEHKNHAYSVALATVMAAAAAVVAARAAAGAVDVASEQSKSLEKIATEVVYAASVQRESSEKTATEAVHAASVQHTLSEKRAAIKIQTAFRRYLARRELRSLRSERLKSYIEGQSTKRQATTTLICMQTLARVQSQIRARRLRMLEENQILQQQLQKKREKEVEEKNTSMGSDWHGSSKSKEQSEGIKQNMQEAAKRRERALAYAFTHQRSWKVSSKATNQTLVDQQRNPHWGWSWLERWMAARPWEISNSTPNNAVFNSVAAFSISNNDNNKPSTTPSKLSSTRPPTRRLLSTPPSKVASISSVSSTIGQLSPRGTRRGGNEDSSSDRLQRRHSSIGGLSSLREDESLGISAPASPKSNVATVLTQTTKTRQSRLSSSSGLSGLPERGLAPAEKKRLSLPLKASTNTKHSGPPRADNSTLVKDKVKKEGKLRNGGEAGSGGGKEL